MYTFLTDVNVNELAHALNYSVSDGGISIGSIDILWTLIGAALVFFMQAGFAMVETGFTRAKNAGNIIMKNLMDFCVGTVVFWIIGYGIMFGDSSSVFGGFHFFLDGMLDGGDIVGNGAFTTIIFQTVFCATAATIVSGAMAERTKFSSYLIYSLIISLVIYPISGHWSWGGGWLSDLGFHDFAGSANVHMVGGVAALVGAKILGPRIGKYDKDGKPKAIPGHSLTLGALGVFILWFCWFGFNGASTVSMSGESANLAGSVFMTTNLAAAAATVVTMVFTWAKYGKPDVSMTLNGSLAGLVAITAGCDVVTPAGAAIIGMIAGVSVVIGIEFVDKVLKIDDPVGAVGVHCINGALGTLLTGLFAAVPMADGNADFTGLFYGGSFEFFGVQLLGVVCIIAWVAVTMIIVFKIIKNTVGLRVSPHEEVVGLDIEEHGIESSYADFMPTHTVIENNTEEVEVPVQVIQGGSRDGERKITNVEIICKEERFEKLKERLNAVGVTGITVTRVSGCGVQKGNTKFYRGIPMDITLLPKIKVEVVVSAVPVGKVIEAAKKALYTGNIGDGKIFVYGVENAVKVRTGQEGFDALQGIEE
ncbi:MAG: ammonium transporter [Clostridiales bacterium]|nr:ammonium transporter [Clostridiales bacterium]